MKAEYAQRPPTFSIEHLPSSRCEVLLRENIAEAQRTAYEGEETYYTADEYCITVHDRDSIEEAVGSSFDEWLQTAKAAEIDRVSAEVRARRNKLLEATDWTQTIDAPISTASRDALRVYRQELRDLSDREEWPYIADWPQAPAIEKAHTTPTRSAARSRTIPSIG